MWKPVDGTGVEESLKMAENEQLNTSGNAQFATSPSPDGRFLLFSDKHAETGMDIWLVELKGNRKPQPWLATEFTETAAMFSLDGRWIAYQSDASGQFEIYVRPFPGPGPTHRVSTAGGREPVWSRDGNELFYRQRNFMMALSVTTRRAFTAGRPVVLFEGYYRRSRVRALYDVSPDGQRFLMVQGGAPARNIKVVLNWAEDLKRLVPTEK